MGFNLTEALGYDKVLSNLDKMEVEPVGLQWLKENEKNFFSVDSIQDLKDSIVMHGILQPLLVVPDGDGYRIVAGHRRYAAAKALVEEGNAQLKEVPCVILPEMSEAMEWATLIQTNTAARTLTYAEKAEAVARMKKQILKLKSEGVKISGNLREMLSEQLEVSKTEIARMEVIEKNLIPEAKDLLRRGEMSPSAAYAMARTDPDCQEEILNMKPVFSPAFISEYAETRNLDWMNQNCPHPYGHYQITEKAAGKNVPCPEWRSVKKHKEKGHPERCPGCCSDCPDLAKCKDACSNARAALAARNAAAARAACAQEILEQREAAKQAFLATRFVHIGQTVRPLIDRGEISLEDIAELWSDSLAELVSEADGFDEGHVASMIHAETIDDVDWPLTAFIAFCDAVKKTPNALLGYDDVACGSWRLYHDEKPAENQRVVIRRTVGQIVRCGEYVYRGGEWYEPGLDDFKMNITGVTHWIECPEET